MYLELYKDARDLVRKCIVTASTLVLGFGITMIGFAVSGQEIVEGDPYDFTNATLFTCAFVLGWVFYFYITKRVENIMYTSLLNMKEKELIDNDEYKAAISAHTKLAKYGPFLFSMLLYILVMLPIDLS